MMPREIANKIRLAYPGASGCALDAADAIDALVAENMALRERVAMMEAALTWIEGNAVVNDPVSDADLIGMIDRIACVALRPDLASPKDRRVFDAAMKYNTECASILAALMAHTARGE
jgi:hypothetical protein